MARTAPSTAALPWRGPALDVALLCALKVTVGAYVLHLGFSHVSDDDFARTVIAEQFAANPRLDPSGTSWLPLPFWIAGSAMWILGRSLAAARAIAITLGALTVALPYAAMRRVGTHRAVALSATAMTMIIPWNAWLGVATVPEGWTGAVAAAAVIAAADPASRWLAASGLLVASLSRYEPWGACATVAILCVARARARPTRGKDVACALLCLAGPTLWMAWNAHAHGDPLHFLARVTAFRRAIGAARAPMIRKVLDYPMALLSSTPEAAALGTLGLLGMAIDPSVRRRWAWPAVAVAATFAFLIAGDLGDGAPTHHPERALSGTWWILIGMGVDTVALLLVRAGTRARRFAYAGLAAASLAWCVTLPSRWSNAPGSSDYDRRDAQIARGLDMRRRGVPNATIAPCAFEHFALLAAWGEPEHARVLPSMHRAPTADCPLVDENADPQSGPGTP